MTREEAQKQCQATPAALLVLGFVIFAGVCYLAARQLAGDFLPMHDPVADDLERVLSLLWRLIDLVAERCGG